MKKAFIDHVGSRIKTFRLEAGLSVGALAGKIGKSRKTVYNYECGITAADIVTLLDISHVLNISLFELLDYEWQIRPAARLYPFGQFEAIDRLYMYHLQDGEVHSSVIRTVAPSDSGITVIMYYKSADLDAPERCDCIYMGYAFSEYSTLCFVMRNHFNKAENILINLAIRNPGNPDTVGLISGLDARTLEPVAFKALVSINRVSMENVRSRLKMTPDEYKKLRNTSVFRAEEL